MSRRNGWDNPPPRLNPQQTRQIDLRQLPGRAAPLRHTRIVVTVRELDDLLREDVRRELERLHDTLPVYAIDINDPFLSSRLFATGWDDPQMAGYACWYQLQQIFSWLANMGWGLILHTGLTTRCDLLQRFLRLAANHFPRRRSPAGDLSGTGHPRPAKRRASTPGSSSAIRCGRYCRNRSWGSGIASRKAPLAKTHCSVRRC